jgi:ubiquinone/menaquinone biosynthesis C-methylase UbiE
MLDRARLEPDNTVACIGSGLELLVLWTLERLDSDGSVIAIDISVDRLEALRSECEDARVSYLVGDAAVLPLPDESVDVVLGCSAEAPRELFRVLRSGGRLSLLAAASPEPFAEAGFVDVDLEAAEECVYVAARKA